MGVRMEGGQLRSSQARVSWRNASSSFIGLPACYCRRVAIRGADPDHGSTLRLAPTRRLVRTDEYDGVSVDRSCAAPGQATEEGRVAQRQAGTVTLAPARRAAGGAARGVEAGDRLCVGVQRVATGAGGEATQGEGVPLEVALAVTQGGKGWLGQWAQPFGGLVEVGIPPFSGQTIEFLDRMHQGARRQPKLLLDLLPAFAHRGHRDVRLDDRTTEYLVVHQQPGATVGLAQHVMGHPSVIAVLVDETLTALVDEDALDQRGRRKERQGGEEFLHVQRSGADADAHADAGTVIVTGADLQLAIQRGGCEAFDHGRVADEATGAQHYATARVDKPRRTRLAGDHAHHPPLRYHDQRTCTAVSAHPGTEFDGAAAQELHQHLATAPADKLHGMPAWRRSGLVKIGPGFLVARPQQGVIRGGLVPFTRQIGAL